jgi:hypothetical protein
VYIAASESPGVISENLAGWIVPWHPLVAQLFRTNGWTLRRNSIMAGGSFWMITSRRISGEPFLMISCTSWLTLIALISCGVRPV